MSEGALSDLKVLEFGNLVSAPYCGKLLTDLCAEVIKIEEPGMGDEARSRGPFAQDIPGVERSGLFAYLNTNKLGITLNPRNTRGKALFEELVRNSDILVENHSPRLMEELELTYDALEKINPQLIMTSITPFGQTWAGPHAGRLLADMGARVIKIEIMRRMDVIRSLPPGLPTRSPPPTTRDTTTGSTETNSG